LMPPSVQGMAARGTPVHWIIQILEVTADRQGPVQFLRTERSGWQRDQCSDLTEASGEPPLLHQYQLH
jgi:hypothetical protein